MAELPKITLVTVVRNGAAFIEQCLASVAQQHYDNLEYIIMDGASTDGTQTIIERYRPLITHFYSRPDKGAYDAAQQAFAMATGQIVGYLMADDWLSPGALHTLGELYRNKPNAEIFCFGMQEYKKDTQGQLKKTKHYCDPPGEEFTLADGMYCQGVNRFYSARMIREEGYFRENFYKNLADRDLYLRLGARRVSKAWTDKILYNFLVHSGSNSTGGSPAKFVTFLDETCRIAEDYRALPAISREDRKKLDDWYCFNAIRSIWFRLKTRKWDEALGKACMLFAIRPVATLRTILNWKMPEAYRAKYDQ